MVDPIMLPIGPNMPPIIPPILLNSPPPQPTRPPNKPPPNELDYPRTNDNSNQYSDIFTCVVLGITLAIKLQKVHLPISRTYLSLPLF
jgi:hypothetical protein